MAFIIHRLEKGQSFVIATDKLYLDDTKTRLVAEGDPASAFLFCCPGQYIPRADAIRYGMADESTPTVKESRPQETKETLPQETKSGGKKGK